MLYDLKGNLDQNIFERNNLTVTIFPVAPKTSFYMLILDIVTKNKYLLSLKNVEKNLHIF